MTAEERLRQLEDQASGKTTAQQGLPGYLNSTSASPPGSPASAPSGSAGDSWSDILPWNAKPARPGPQTWFDWFSKNYNPSPADLAKIYADAAAYHTPSLALQGAQAMGVPTFGYTPQDYRAGMQQARDAAGPAAIGPTALGYITSPLTYTGVGPLSRVAGAAIKPAAESLLPSAIAKVAPTVVSGGTQSAITGASQTAGQGGGVWDTAKSALTNFLLGGAVSGAVSPLARSPVTAEDVAAKTAADLRAAQSKSAATAKVAATPEATQAQAAAVAAAREAYVQDQIAKGAPDFQARFNAAAPSNEDFIMRQYGGGATGPGQAAADATAAQRAQSAQANAAMLAAQQKAQGGQTLLKWSDMVNLGQTKAVQGEAGDMAGGFPSGTPQRSALQGIATATPKQPPEWVPAARAMLPLAGGSLGELGTMATGKPYLSSIGTGAGTLGAWGLGKVYPTQALPPILQQRIAQASGPMTGYPTNQGGNTSSLANALMYIYQNSPQSQQPQ